MVNSHALRVFALLAFIGASAAAANAGSAGCNTLSIQFSKVCCVGRRVLCAVCCAPCVVRTLPCCGMRCSSCPPRPQPQPVLSLALRCLELWCS